MINTPKGFTGELNSDDQEARTQLIENFLSHGQQLARLILSKNFRDKQHRIRGEMDSEDLAMQALSDLLHKQKTWRSTAQFNKTLHRAIYQDCIDIVRRFQREDSRMQADSEVCDPEQHEIIVEWNDTLEAMEAWNTDVYAVFCKKMLAHQSDVAVAQELEIDRGTVARRWKMGIGWIAKQGYALS